MSPRPRGRTQPCGREEAATRLAHARKFLDVAELCADEEHVPESASVAAALAVLAGIAASDCACCAATGLRSRAQDHRDAQTHLAQIHPGGDEAARALKRLLDVKDTAHYGLINVSGEKLKASLRQARSLVEFASEVLRR